MYGVYQRLQLLSWFIPAFNLSIPWIENVEFFLKKGLKQIDNLKKYPCKNFQYFFVQVDKLNYFCTQKISKIILVLGFY